jgi:hypothetical protein
MPKYSFVIATESLLTIDIEAKSLEEARDKAYDAPVASLCTYCAGKHPGEWGILNELAGDLTDSTLVECSVDGQKLSVEGLGW